MDPLFHSYYYYFFFGGGGGGGRYISLFLHSKFRSSARSRSSSRSRRRRRRHRCSSKYLDAPTLHKGQQIQQETYTVVMGIGRCREETHDMTRPRDPYCKTRVAEILRWIWAI